MMRIILRRRLGIAPGRDQAEYRQLALKVRELTVGRAADRHVHVEHPQVALRHAHLFLRDGALYVRADGPVPVDVNGTLCRRARLEAGDVMTFGATRLTVERLLDDGVIVLRHHDPQILSTARVDDPAARSLKDAGLNARAWSGYLVLALLILGFIAPLGSALLGAVRPVARRIAVPLSDVSWQPGALHAAHRAIGNDCNVCHTTPFKRVENAACTTCHQAIHQHVESPLLQVKLFATAQCADCHIEHSAQASLIDPHPANCTVCHTDIKASAPTSTVHDVGSFSSAHPDCKIQTAQRLDAQQHTNLEFSHKVHLDTRGVDSPTGRRTLACTDCHSTDAGGRYMMPVRMEKHCVQCHSLRFDEHDPASRLPHGDLPAVFKTLREHLSRAYLDQRLGGAAPGGTRRRPGDEQALLTEDQQRRALAWADLQTSRVAKELLEKRVCVECHVITRLPPGLPEAESWRVQPVHLAERWYADATFSHAKHKTETCSSCHAQIDTAEDSAAVHMPGIATCRSCHGDDRSAKVATTCITCHDFHRPGTGLFTAAASLTAGARRR